jgi:hypothetical protein
MLFTEDVALHREKVIRISFRQHRVFLDTIHSHRCL